MKSIVRRKILNKRRRLNDRDIRSKSLAICKGLVSTDAFINSRNVMAFMSFRNEVDTRFIVDHCLATNRKVIIPITDVKNKKLILSELWDPDTELGISPFGIPEPLPQFIRPFNATNLDLVLVPGVAFDRRGYRIGYGGGYYDRFLASIGKKVHTIGLAFELQITGRIPIDAYDIPVDCIITEKDIIDCLANRSEQ
jgi:5-formyltetrahydrofolate cyclo-ligase